MQYGIERTPSPVERWLAMSLVGFFALLTMLAMRFGADQGPHLTSFIPMFGTLSAGAELLTAYILFIQWRVSGLQPFLVVAAAYLFTGLLLIPYTLYFPGALPFSEDLALHQVSISLWISWHLAFPCIIGIYALRDPDFAKIRSFASRRSPISGWQMAGVAVAAAAVATLALIERAHLPIFISGGTFRPIFKSEIAPILSVLSLCASALLFSRTRGERGLPLWLSVALFVEAMDCVLNAGSTARYALMWYAGKLETFATATIVLIALLRDLPHLYGRIAGLANTDYLTGLFNRRSFNDQSSYLQHQARRRPIPASVLMIDIDNFKRYNDAFGHPAGDRCLRAVSAVLREAVPRAADTVARFGGEEFVVLLSGAPETAGVRVAERIRSAIEDAQIAQAPGTGKPFVTVSIGVAGSDNLGDTDVPQLLSDADRALYRAKRLGRNQVCSVEDLLAATGVFAQPAGDGAH